MAKEKTKKTQSKSTKKKTTKKKVVKKNKHGDEIHGFVRMLDNGNYLVDKGHPYFLYEQGKKGGNASLYFEEELVMNIVVTFIESRGVKFETHEDEHGNKIRTKVLNFPSIDELGEFMDISDDTLERWRKKSRKLSGAIEKIKRMQKNLLMKGGLTGELRENFARFVLTVNHNMVDRSEVENTFKVAEVNILPPSNDTKIIDVTAEE